MPRRAGGGAVNLRRPAPPPEDSIAMRVVVALAVELGIWAVVTRAAVAPVDGGGGARPRAARATCSRTTAGTGRTW